MSAAVARRNTTAIARRAAASRVTGARPSMASAAARVAAAVVSTASRSACCRGGGARTPLVTSCCAPASSANLPAAAAARAGPGRRRRGAPDPPRSASAGSPTRRPPRPCRGLTPELAGGVHRLRDLGADERERDLVHRLPERAVLDRRRGARRTADGGSEPRRPRDAVPSPARSRRRRRPSRTACRPAPPTSATNVSPAMGSPSTFPLRRSFTVHPRAERRSHLRMQDQGRRAARIQRTWSHRKLGRDSAMGIARRCAAAGRGDGLTRGQKYPPRAQSTPLSCRAGERTREVASAVARPRERGPAASHPLSLRAPSRSSPTSSTSRHSLPATGTPLRARSRSVTAPRWRRPLARDVTAGRPTTPPSPVERSRASFPGTISRALSAVRLALAALGLTLGWGRGGRPPIHRRAPRERPGRAPRARRHPGLAPTLVAALAFPVATLGAPLLGVFREGVRALYGRVAARGAGPERAEEWHALAPAAQPPLALPPRRAGS